MWIFKAGRYLAIRPCFPAVVLCFEWRPLQRWEGSRPGHLTEDLDLTNRFWLKGWKGIYLSDVINYGEVPFTYDHYRRQQERWAAGSARSLRDYIWPVITTRRLGCFEKLSAIRQNAYFTTTLLTGSAILLGILTILWIALFWNTYSVEYYLYILGMVKVPFVLVVYGCILSNFVEPLVMILVKKRSYREILHLPHDGLVCVVGPTHICHWKYQRALRL